MEMLAYQDGTFICLVARLGNFGLTLKFIKTAVAASLVALLLKINLQSQQYDNMSV